jgi:2'-5' RNA ligase
MTDPNLVDNQSENTLGEELERFRKIQWLTNHWARPIGPRAYYWYLTFDHSSGLRYLAERCQREISFPHYDLTPPSDLHLTLDRIGFEDDVTRNDLSAIEAAATRACQRVTPFDITIGALGGTPGAIGFTAYPERPIRALRDELRGATLSVYRSAPIKHSTFHPHVAIAYCNSDDVPAAGAVAAVESVRATARISLTIRDVSLVLLARRPRAYEWTTLLHIPLSGRPQPTPDRDDHASQTT